MTKHPIFLALAATAALALGACGSANNDNKSGGDKAEDKAFAGALKFAKCMRDHGLDVPDPTHGPNGGIQQKINQDKGAPARSDQAAMEKAQKACEKYMVIGGGEAPDPAEQAKRQDAFIAYARCMRAAGINMPDPKFEGNRVTMGVRAGAGGPDPDSPAFKAADKTCHPKLAAVDGGPGGARAAKP
jgi:hypothetical protein